MKAITALGTARTLAAARTAARTAAALGATLGTAAALLLMAACTADNLPPDALAGTDPALAPGAVVTRIAEKPGYAPAGENIPQHSATTRTNPVTGAWQTGEEVTAYISFYSDAAGESGKLLSEVMQTLTYTADAPAPTPKWSAVPALVPIPATALSLRVTYDYTGEADPLTDTKEVMTGRVAQASGSAIYPDDPDKVFPPEDNNGRLIPIADVTGTLALVPTFKRSTAVVSLLMQPGQEVELATAYGQPGRQPEGDGLLHLPARLPAATDAATAKPATAHFHLLAPSEANADADAATAAKATFRLTLKGEPSTRYPAVPIRTGWQYQLSTDAIPQDGTGGDDKQKE